MSRVLTILAHGDADGVCSAAIVKAALSGEYDEVRVYFTHPVDLLKDFGEAAAGDVYVVDVAIDELVARDVSEALRGHGGRVVYIDHHPLSVELPGVEVVHEEGASASELAYRLLGGRLPAGYSRVALYGAISDYLDDTQWVRDALSMWDRRVVYFEAGVLTLGLERARKDHEIKRAAVDHLSRNAAPSALPCLLRLAEEQARVNEELVAWVDKYAAVDGAVAYVVNPPGPLGLAATLARGLRGVEVGVAAERRKDGTCAVSMRSASLDLSEFLRHFARKHGVHAGGHRRAAGARMPASLLPALVSELNSWWLYRTLLQRGPTASQ
jgi:RecJ-like exonuclease